MRVLVVNDSKSTLLALEGLLSSQGYEVLTARNGLEAIEKLDTSPCQIVLLDWEMPVMNGLEFCRTVRSRFFSRYVYILFLSSHEDTKKKLEGLAAGADDFIVATGSRDELLTKLQVARRNLNEIPRPMMVRTLQILLRNQCRDVEECGARITRYGLILLEQLKRQDGYKELIDKEYLNQFQAICPLLDVGYSEIPREIVLNLKKGKLSSLEYSVLKNHPKIGGRLFEELMREFPDSPFLEMGRDLILTHHERFDGSGYPFGLKGKEIPLVGRIVFLSDSYDALTTHRGWSEPFSHDYVRWLILEGRGIHFDPDLVDAFLAGEAFFKTVSTENPHEEIEISL